MTKEEIKNKISMALKDTILQQGFEIICKNLSELEEENAELKEVHESDKRSLALIAKKGAELEKENVELKTEKGCETCTKFDEVQLTKAKELLKRFIETSEPVYFDEDRQRFRKLKIEAEQFLKENE